MTLFSLLKKEDYLMIKWPISFAVVGLLIASGIYFGVDYLASESQRDLRIAQSNFNSALSRVELIEEEEATIVEYIGRYQTLQQENVIAEEDRLQLLELVAELRAENNLFPVAMNINEQTAMMLSYPPTLGEPGQPISLRSSTIGLEMPLLHEADLTRLLTGIIDSPGLFQTRQCTLDLNSTDTTRFIFLARHLSANCEILWYTFDLNPPQPVDPFGY